MRHMSCQSPGLCFACVLPICMCYLTLKCVVCVCVCVLNKQSFLVSLVAPDKKESSTPGWLVVLATCPGLHEGGQQLCYACHK